MKEKKKFGKVLFLVSATVLPIISEKTRSTTGRFRVRVIRTDRYGNETENNICFPRDPYNGTNEGYLRNRVSRYTDSRINYGLRRKVKYKPLLASV